MLNDTIKLPDENPSIGIIICKEKTNYSRICIKREQSTNRVATYKLTETLPYEFKDLLPTANEISQRLENLLESENND